MINRTVSGTLTYIFKLLHIIVGEHISFLQILLWVKGITHHTLPKGTQEVQWKWHICTDCYAQKLTKEMEQLFFCISYRAGCQDVLSLKKVIWNSGQCGILTIPYNASSSY